MSAQNSVIKVRIRSPIFLEFELQTICECDGIQYVAIFYRRIMQRSLSFMPRIIRAYKYNVPHPNGTYILYMIRVLFDVNFMCLETTTPFTTTSIAPTTDFCGAYVFDQFLTTFSMTQLSDIVEGFNFTLNSNYQITLTNFIRAETESDSVTIQSFLASAVYANVMTRLEFMRFIYDGLDIEQNTEICRLFALPNYDVVITETYLEISFSFWSDGYAEFDWDSYSFRYY